MIVIKWKFTQEEIESSEREREIYGQEVWTRTDRQTIMNDGHKDPESLSLSLSHPYHKFILNSFPHLNPTLIIQCHSVNRFLGRNKNSISLKLNIQLLNFNLLVKWMDGQVFRTFEPQNQHQLLLYSFQYSDQWWNDLSE